MMPYVSTKQLVVQPGPSGAELLDAVDQRVDARPWDYEDKENGTRPKILGTRGLLELAHELAQHGYRISELDLRDSNFEPLPSELEEGLEASLKNIVKLHGSLESADLVILENDAVVVSITARIPHSAEELQVNRDGEIRYRRDESFKRFREDLERALGYGTGS